MEIKEYKRVVNAWVMYDWANSAFATTVMAGFLPVYFRSMAINGGLSEVDATSAWAFTTTVALLIIALLAPAMGYLADQTGSKRFLLTLFAVVGAGASMMLFIPHGDMYRLASIIYIVGNIGFAGANIFYNALLPHVAKADDIDQVSVKGFALGYLGGGLLLIINVLMFMKPTWFGIPNGEMGVRISFITVGIWWLLFTIPFWRHVKEPVVEGKKKVSFTRAFSDGFRELAQTFKKVRAYPNAFKMLVAFWLYNDGIGTIIKMATAYGDEIGIGQTEMIGALALVQFVGIPFSFAFGSLAKRLGTKRSILVGLLVYAFISIGGYFMQTAVHFWILAFFVGLVQGGTQGLSRSLFGSMIPKSRSGEFFGFFSMSDKFAGIVGPFVFAMAAQLAGTSRLGILSLIIFFVLGGILLMRVDEKEGIRTAREGDAAFMGT